MAKRESSSSFWISIVLFSFAVMLGLAVVENDYTLKASISEAKKIEAEMGGSTLRKINELASHWYLSSLRKLESMHSDVDWYSKDPDQREREQRFLEDLYGNNTKLQSWINHRKEALLDLYYWILRRFALFVVLLPLWIPLALLAIFHGLQEREIKKTDFGYTSPVKNHWARRSIGVSTLMLFLVFFAPIAIEPMIFPLIMAAITVAIGIAFGNIQKQI